MAGAGFVDIASASSVSSASPAGWFGGLTLIGETPRWRGSRSRRSIATTSRWLLAVQEQVRDGVRVDGRPAGPAHPAAGIRGRSGAAALLRGRPGQPADVASLGATAATHSCVASPRTSVGPLGVGRRRSTPRGPAARTGPVPRAVPRRGHVGRVAGRRAPGAELQAAPRAVWCTRTRCSRVTSDRGLGPCESEGRLGRRAKRVCLPR